MGMESALLGSALTAISGLLGVVLAKCKMIYKRDEDGNCSPVCAFSDKPIQPDNDEIKVEEYHLDNIPVLILSKKN